MHRVTLASASRCCASLALIAALVCQASAQTTPQNLDEMLKGADVKMLAREARRRGNAERGALVFYTSSAACIKCHTSGAAKSPLGPDLAALGEAVTDEHVVEAILHPSLKIRKGYESVSVITDEGKTIVGMVADDRKDEIVLRDATNLEQEIVIKKSEIDETVISRISMMPDGLAMGLRNQSEFYDLVRYVIDVTQGGVERAAALKPSAEELAATDDTKDLDHAGIIKRLSKRDLKAGGGIYGGLCANCHGVDGNKPSLPNARAFAAQKLKFGADPYKMFLTLSHGNGLMGPALQLSPKERYQVIHYIRETFMKDRNPDYSPVAPEYLTSLPKGTGNGEAPSRKRPDVGPALASQLERRVSSALTIKLGKMTISYDLHSMDQAGVWNGGFLDVNATQHMRGRGEGVPLPHGEKIEGLSGWQWGHGGTLDYSREGLLPRGPLPGKWFDYRGHYLHGDRVVLSYKIDGRDVLELPRQEGDLSAMRHGLRIGAGDDLILAVSGATDGQQDFGGVVSKGGLRPRVKKGPATDRIALKGKLASEELSDFTVAAAFGDTQGMTWEVDDKHRIVLHIPADTIDRVIEIVRFAGTGQSSMQQFHKLVNGKQANPASDPKQLTQGGKQRWPDVLTTVGDLGLQRGAYVLDTLKIPDSTPWNTWFRTSALDFFPDGRMALATHGGDVWIVSGIDDDLLDLKWKRFAGGLYEPFGLKVVDGKIYVTCKDRLTRLHDLNKDGEADFYESFSADTDVSINFHAFAFDLQTDSKGNFYYAKSGQYTDYALPGAVIKISPDGKQREVYAKGFRTPNGMGMMPNDRPTASDNQGNWMPASKVSLLKPGGFYGYVQTHADKRKGNWAPDGGRIDHTKVIPPKTFDQPLIWMPQNYDNSSGGQLWVEDSRWGPISGRLLHTSFGKGWLYYMMLQEVGDVSQAAIIKMPFDFSTGIMRARVNPTDGQVYATGLDGWNGNGRRGLVDRGIQRVRYTGKPLRMVTDCRVEHDGLRLTFNFPLDAETAMDVKSYVGQTWNYQWRASYGSGMFSPKTDKPGKDDLQITSVTVSDDGMSVKLVVDDIQPVNQVHLNVNLKGREGQVFQEEIYWTINRVPGQR